MSNNKIKVEEIVPDDVESPVEQAMCYSWIKTEPMLPQTEPEGSELCPSTSAFNIETTNVTPFESTKVNSMKIRNQNSAMMDDARNVEFDDNVSSEVTTVCEDLQHLFKMQQLRQSTSSGISDERFSLQPTSIPTRSEDYYESSSGSDSPKYRQITRSGAKFYSIKNEKAINNTNWWFDDTSIRNQSQSSGKRLTSNNPRRMSNRLKQTNTVSSSTTRSITCYQRQSKSNNTQGMIINNGTNSIPNLQQRNGSRTINTLVDQHHSQPNISSIKLKESTGLTTSDKRVRKMPTKYESFITKLQPDTSSATSDKRVRKSPTKSKSPLLKLQPGTSSATSDKRVRKSPTKSKSPLKLQRSTSSAESDKRVRKMPTKYEPFIIKLQPSTSSATSDKRVRKSPSELEPGTSSTASIKRVRKLPIKLEPRTSSAASNKRVRKSPSELEPSTSSAASNKRVCKSSTKNKLPPIKLERLTKFPIKYSDYARNNNDDSSSNKHRHAMQRRSSIKRTGISEFIPLIAGTYRRRGPSNDNDVTVVTSNNGTRNINNSRQNPFVQNNPQHHNNQFNHLGNQTFWGLQKNTSSTMGNYGMRDYNSLQQHPGDSFDKNYVYLRNRVYKRQYPIFPE